MNLDIAENFIFQEKLEKFHKMFKGFEYDIPNFASLRTLVHVTCDKKHESLRSIKEHLANNGCPVCNGEKAMITRRIRHSAEMMALLDENFNISDDAIRNLTVPNKMVLITCKKMNHVISTTKTDIVESCIDTDEFGSETRKSFTCEECEEHDSEARFLNSIMRHLDNLPGKPFIDIRLARGQENTVVETFTDVILVCEHKHTTPMRASEVFNTSTCPMCDLNSKREITQIFVDSAHDNISPSTRRIETIVAANFEAKAHCENGHVMTDGYCGLCAGDNEIAVETLLPYLNTLSTLSFSVSSAYLSPDDEIEAICPEHGPFKTTPRNITTGSYHCPFCLTTNLFDTIKLFVDDNGNHVIALTSLESNPNAISNSFDAKVLYVKEFSSPGLAELFFTLLVKATENTTGCRPHISEAISPSFEVSSDLIHISHMTKFVELFTCEQQSLDRTIGSATSFSVNLPSIFTAPYL